jgi:hypothetical protein
MSKPGPIRRSKFCLLSLLLAPAALGLGQRPGAPTPEHPVSARDGYIGDEACRPCHQQEFKTYLNSAHHIASRLPTSTSIKGSFTPGSNVLRTSNPYLYFVMNATEGSFFQTAVATLPPSEIISHQEPFALVIGSGRKGQTYLYWKGNELFELPVSYWTETNQWVNSPGYPDGLPNFDKPIIPRCLECHTTFAAPVPLTIKQFNKTSLVLGVSCERCHGAGRAHVARTQSKTSLLPGEAEDIVDPAKLARDRQMDLCALCHAGPATPRASAFSFTAGAVLSEYLTIPDTAPDAPSDVHAHQVQQLRSSRCYQSSAMTCSTCHNVHTPQRDVASFSQRCLTCHKAENCGRYAAMGSQILRDCVNCHMPLKKSDQIVLDTQGVQVNPQVRTHRIAIYSDIVSIN